MEELEIHERIRIQRQRKGYSQEAMAFELGISQGTYSKIERGETEITAKRLCEIADILKINVIELLPKSKYGSGINVFGLKNAWRKFRDFFRFRK